MTQLLQLFCVFPLVGFLITLGLPKERERWISGTAYVITSLHFTFCVLFLVWWIFNGHTPLATFGYLTFRSSSYQFVVDFYFDAIAVTFLFVGSLVTLLVAVYSRYYMHRESGYKRFFSTILFFYIGYNITVLSGNLETLFIGWEILGISSFLLIAFYRERYLPVKNAVKVFSIYRAGDIGIILAIWMVHILWHGNFTFFMLNEPSVFQATLREHSSTGVLIALMIIVAASAKSAQLPFTSWLPRAMEGPTPSSAIFYGSLSVHLGAFLLLRTFPVWQPYTSIRILVAIIGIATTFISTGIARVQSSIKSQIAYGSAAQIGILFVEIAAGFQTLAIIHFAGNAFLRTYQLLVSPSVVSYLIREQFYNFSPDHRSIEDSFPKRMENTLYILCTKEWNLDSMLYRWLWNPMKWIGRQLNILHFRLVVILGSILFTLWLFVPIVDPPMAYRFLAPSTWSIIFALVALAFVLKAFTDRREAYLCWLSASMSQVWIYLAITFNQSHDTEHTLMYLGGILISGLTGILCLYKLGRTEGKIYLDQFHGHAHHHRLLAVIFFLSALGIAGFPITPTFIGIDIVLAEIAVEQFPLAILCVISFVLTGLAVVRIYARIFLGPYARSEYEIAYRSS
jgi:NADH:ubiquinone oxidoreductase subunit 5 (subunit L)/multisubunit Na+/H+ antiporter MnhA subunit